MTTPERLAIYCGPMDGNSTARIAVRLANGFVAAGTPTDLLTTGIAHLAAESLDPAVTRVELGRQRVGLPLVRLVLYLRRHRPTAILTHRIRENGLTQRAVRLSGLPIPVFATVHGPLSFKLAHLEAARRRKRTAQVERWYRRNRALIAISEETAADLRTLLGTSVPIETIPNPIVTSDLEERAAGPVGHPWFADPSGPVLVFAGRFVREKDLTTLLRAVALVRAKQDCRLLMIGEGPLRADLEAERARLGLADQVAMPGFMTNPYPYLRAADLVVLSSVWDALPTVLIEAMALGTPVVSTDCGAGPREILDHGRLGPLVAPGDAHALAAAIAATLAAPPDPRRLREGAARYDAARNAERYRRLLLSLDPA
ncbi:glycosyltransferase [Thioalkalicoccus limnaeus]|uniref:Glycosyltransferase n=1 Tax=Thioalkalicoccus limnaeus TaxID=120681 RepID=A0ABV4BBZ5_9GAMM